jgi:exodeoxyribonuclease VII large subunit
MSSNRYIYSVSELNAAAKSVLENDLGRIWIEAEISNMSRPASGHWYFTLKDQKAQIRCAFFKGSNRLVNFTPEDGQLLLVRGRVSLYEPRGDYQLIVDQMEPAGIGDLQRAFEETRQRLLEAGLFDEAHKQPLPTIPKRIGLITSPSGAAIRDVLHVLRRRYPMVPVVLYPTSVQGASAATEIMQALGHAVNRNECDVLLMTRGGGSIEDLWPFNDEQLAKAIYDCPIPIISGVGHEIDFTIADFVADVRAPTPSAAAEMLVPDQLELRRLLQRHQRQLTQQMQDSLRTAAQQTDWYRTHINQFHPG